MESYKQNSEDFSFGLTCNLCGRPARYICSCIEPKASICSQHIDSHKKFSQSNNHQLFDCGIDLTKNKPSYIESLQLCLIFLSAKKQKYIKTLQEKILSLNIQLTETLKNLDDIEKKYQQAIHWVLNNSEIIPNKINKPIYDILSIGRSGAHFIFTSFQNDVKDEPNEGPCENCRILKYENQEIKDKIEQVIEWNETLKKFLAEYEEEIKMMNKHKNKSYNVPAVIPAPVAAKASGGNSNQIYRNQNEDLKKVLENLIGIIDGEKHLYSS
ncbi:hypothetical protein SteCoe_17170 [Stentor coeruleus]|uniref:Uncharacterized protein n=1 Tax=Stentor coeruleus TaxID=5963 RepID=A0A1R2BZM4_9CILI|nr:hypothetical protein SteCoe_17170 [Stentor coeruleus]